jgi:tRNA(fMet)-specific endonuclease VapC
MSLCLDTNAAIEVIRGQKGHFREWLVQAEEDGRSLHLSPIVLFELMYGAHNSQRADNHMARVDRLASQMVLESWTPDDALAAARLRAELRLSGASIGNLDVLIAGQALNRGWTIITANLREFIRVKGLALEDWSDAAGPVLFRGGDFSRLQP